MLYFFNENGRTFQALDTNYTQNSKKNIIEQKILNKKQILINQEIYGKAIIDFKLQGFFEFQYYFWTSPAIFLVYLASFIWLLQKLIFYTIMIIGAMLVASVATYIFTYISEKKILQKSKKVIKVKRFFLDEQNQIQQETVDSDQLVPNDIIEIEPGTVLTCDLVIIQGEAFVNEANITGESDPVPKVQLQNSEKPLNFEQDSASIIYEGTSIIVSASEKKKQKNSQNNCTQKTALGNVIRTAFSTKKGQVIRCTLFPAAKLQEFQRSFIKFTLFLMALGLFAQLFMLFFWFQNQIIPQKFPFIKLGETIITFGAPSASILFVFSQVAALIRLLKKNIQGNNPNAIYACGTVQTVCFDKTGTITENYVALNDVWSCQNQFLNLKNNQQQNKQKQKQKQMNVAQSQDKDQKNLKQSNFAQNLNQDQKNQGEKYIQDIEKNNEFKNQLKKKWVYNQQIQALFACCHQIQQVFENGINQIQGDQTDIQMFEYSQYQFQEQQNKSISEEKIKENSENNIKKFDSFIKIQNQFDSEQYFQILKRFEFKSIFASMSVLVQNQNQEQFIFCKGSPEKLKQISLKSSIPQDFDHILNKLSLKGYRIIGLGYKKIDNQFQNQQQIENYEREHAETDLEFLGFLILENQLKPDSKEQFDRLKQSNLNLKILSGDNSLTVIHTASQVEILDKNQKIFEINFDQEQNLFQIKEILEEKIINHKFNNLENLKSFTDSQQQQLIQQKQQKKYIQMAINGSFLRYYQNFTNKTKNQGQIYIQQSDNQLQNIFDNFIKIATVYSRCTPNLKQLVIQILKKQNEKVAMIGDGANDCLAINEATVGISFASAEAALSSPFCTNEDSIKCVEQVLLEGRNTLSINYELTHLYLYMGFLRYLQHNLQLFYYQYPNDFQQFMQTYGCGIILQMFFLCFCLPISKINQYKIQCNLTSKRSIIQTTGQWLISLILILGFLFNLQKQDFFDEKNYLEEKDELNKGGYINTQQFYIVSLLLSLKLLYLFVSFPVKKPIYRQYPLFFCQIVFLTWVILIFFLDYDFFSKFYLVKIPQSYRVKIFVWTLVTGLVLFLYEFIVVRKFWLEDNQNQKNKKIK